jgi:hypothetical protein
MWLLQDRAAREVQFGDEGNSGLGEESSSFVTAHLCVVSSNVLKVAQLLMLPVLSVLGHELSGKR